MCLDDVDDNGSRIRIKNCGLFELRGVADLDTFLETMMTLQRIGNHTHKLQSYRTGHQKPRRSLIT